jgi:endoribonuclease Dicer
VTAEAVSAVFHGTVVAGPIVSNSKTIARFAAAEKALVALRDTDEGELLKKLCDCRQRMNLDHKKKDQGVDQRSEEADEDEEDEEEEEEEEEEIEVAQMLTEQEM